MKLEGLKVLVTGGAGFIGSHLVENLLKMKNKVIVVDNLVYTNKIHHLEKHRNLFLYKEDVRNMEAVNKIAEGVDVIFLLASLVGVEDTYKHPLEVLDVEIKGTVNVIEATLANSNVKRIVFASSSEVYGDAQLPMKEGGPLQPKCTYAHAKLIGEALCEAYHQEFGIEYTCLRYFNVYGPRQDNRFVIPRFVERISQGKPPLIYGTGDQVRDFTYIDDAVNMTMLAATKPSAKCEIINIGTGVGTTIVDLVTTILKTLKKHSIIRPKFISYDQKRPKKIEVFNRVADISKTVKLLNYKPKTNLQEGIKMYTEEYFSKKVKASNSLL